MRGKKNIGQRFLFALFCTFAFTVYSGNNPDSWTLSPDGLGPIKIGMTLEEAEKVSDKEFSTRTPQKGMPEDESCFYTSLNKIDSVSFMVSYNKIVRININNGSIRTDTGATIGMSEKELQTLYAHQLSVEVHHYRSDGHYLTYINPQEQRAIRFETDGHKITRMYAGQEKEVQFVEDCL